MATKPSEHNKFIGLKKTIAGIHKDIAFLKKCNEHRVTPISHQVRTRTYTDSKIIRRVESELVKESIKKLYGKLNSKTLECYSLHLKLAKESQGKPKENQDDFLAFLKKVKVAEKCESERKRVLLDKKFKQIVSPIAKVSKPVIQPLDDFVVNRSSESFSEEQLTLLNKGLKYAIISKPNFESIIIDTETAINDKSTKTPLFPSQINSARTEIATVLRTSSTKQKDNIEARIAKELKDKPVYYLKADKGNRVVIMDKNDYDRRVLEKLDNREMFHLERGSPLENMVKQVNSTLKSCKDLLTSLNKNVASLRVSNPTLPRIKALPKVHKPGNEMREIISAVDAPTHKISKWLVEEFKRMPKPFPSRSVTSSQEFTQRILETGTIAEDEIMVSFDVKALFPSVPVLNAIGMVRDWMESQYDEPGWRMKANQYMQLVKLCMEQSFFQFRDDIYRQKTGVPMGNPLAPFISEIFMANLEKGLQAKNQLPDRWWRYVDDVFCIIKRDSLTSVLDTINKEHNNIQFTHETEVDGRLPFLDILIVREPSCESPFAFEIYRKPTNTRRTIPATSNHSFQHKMAAYHYFIHRMMILPLSVEGKQKELDYIFETAEINGYSRTSIQAIINKKERGLHRSSLTTLTPPLEPLRKVAVDFDFNTTRLLRPKLEKFGIDLVFSSKNNQLQTILGSTKDPIENLGKPGVYKVTCSHCDKIYIGQTKRMLKTRLEEHLVKDVNKAKEDMKKGHTPHFKSTIAEHIITQNHKITPKDAIIMRHISKPSKLDVAESLEIYKADSTRLLNKDQGNGSTWLFRLLPRRTTYGLQVPEADDEVLPTLPTNTDTTAMNLQSRTGH